MRQPFLGSLFRFHAWVKRSFGRKDRRGRFRRERLRYRPWLEGLEDRLAPATVSQTGALLTITLNAANERVSISSATTAGVTTYTVTDTNSTFTVIGTAPNFPTGNGLPVGTITSAGLTEIDIRDTTGASNDSFTFATSTGSYSQLFTVDLTHDTAGPAPAVAFNGSSTFTGGLQVTTTNGAIGSSGGALTASGQNVSLSAGGPLNLHSVAIVATGVKVTLADTGTAAADGITADNAGNSLVTNSAFFGEVLSVAAAQANITLVSSSTSTLWLGNVTLGGGTGTGTLSVTANGSIEQPFFSTSAILSGGSATFDVAANTGQSVLLAGGPNNIAGTVTIQASSGGSVTSIALRNINPNAALPTLGTGVGPLVSYTLQFDNNGISLPNTAFPLAGNANLSLTAGGPLVQGAGSAALKTSGSATFSVEGNFGISLTNVNNNLTGPVSFNNPGADATAASAVVFTDSGAINLGPSALGLGTFTVTAGGNITESGTLTQAAGGETLNPAQSQAGEVVTFNVGGTGSQVVLTQNNDFEGPVDITGGRVTIVSLTNTSTLAAVPTIPTTVTSLTLDFTDAPAVLPTLNLSGATDTLSVTADGIFQTQGSTPGTLTVGGTGTFNAGDFPIRLSNANDFNTISVNNSGPNDVSVNDINSLDFSPSTIGSGILTVTTAGTITNNGGGIFQAPNAGTALFSAGSNPIHLNISPNGFTGIVEFSNSGSNIILIRNQGNLTLGSSTIGGNLTATSLSGSVEEAPGVKLMVPGNASFSAGTDVSLDNEGNSFVGNLAFPSVGANVTVRSTNPVSLDTSNVRGNLTVTADGNNGAITQLGTLTVTGTATFNAGTSAITLLNALNSIGTLAVVSTGSAAVTVTTAGAVTLGSVQLGSGSLTINGGGTISQSGPLTQTGPGALSLLTPVTRDVLLTDSGNAFLGALTVTARNVTIDNRGNITFAANATFSSTVTLNAGGTVSFLATGPIAVGSFSSTAQLTTLGAAQNLTAGTGGITFTGAVSLAANLTLDTSAGSGGISFDGDVTAGGALTLSLPRRAQLALTRGHWAQGAGNLTINGTNVAFSIGGDNDHPALFDMGGAGTQLTMQTGSSITVTNDGVFQVGDNPVSAETVTVTIAGGGDLKFAAGSRFLVGLGTALAGSNDELVLAGGGNIVVDPTARLIGDGLASANETVLDAGTGSIVSTSATLPAPGRFDLTVDGSSNPHAFLMGTDIVTPTYTASTLSVSPLAATATNGGTGTASGFQSDGDKWTVTSSGGAASQLITSTDINGNLDIVVRSPAATETLTITTTANGGDGFTTVGGIALDGGANDSETIVAPTANVSGDIVIGSAATLDLDGDIPPVGGRLTALTVRDISGGTAGGASILAGGTPSQTTTIAGRVFTSVHVDLGSALSSLTLTQLTASGSQSSLLAERFGTITVSGNAAAGISGDLKADLADRNAANASAPVAVSLAKVAGDLSGTWDVTGSVGTVTAPRTDNWNLGTGFETTGGANFLNVEKLTNVTSLSLGVVNGTGTLSTVEATGTVAALVATSVENAQLDAGKFGAVATKGNAALGDVGDFNNVTLNTTGTIGSLTVAGNAQGDTLNIENGNVTAITVGRDLSSSTITAAVTPTSGAITSITVGSWGFSGSNTFDAKSVGSLKAVANGTVGNSGSFLAGTVTLHGTPNVSATTLGSLSASNVLNMTFQIDNGGVGTFVDAGQLSGGSLAETSSGGTLGTIQALIWSGFDVTAATIGTLHVTSSAQPGSLTGSSIDAFGGSATISSIGTFAVAGELNLVGGNFVTANGNITSFTVGQDVLGNSSGSPFSSGSPTGAVIRAGGKIGTLTVGDWDTVDLEAASVGTASLKGFTVTEHDTTNTVAGNLTGGSTWFTETTSTSGIGSLTLTGGISGNSTTSAPTVVDVPSGIPVLTAGGQVTNTFLAVDNPLGNTGGHLGALTIGDANGLTLVANSIGSLRTTGDTALGLAGNLNNSSVTTTGFTGTATAPVAIGSITVAGSMDATNLNVPDGITSLTVSRDVGSSSIAAGFAANAKIGTLTTGSFGTSSLTSQSLGTWKVPGEAALGKPGAISSSVVTLMGNSAGVALGSVTAMAVTGTQFHIFDGNVTTFTTGRFIDSQLLVGVHLPKFADLQTSAPATTTSSWNSTNEKIVTFTCTATLFSPTDPVDSAAFQGSQIVAAQLGTASLAGVNPTPPAGSGATSFGVGFRTAAPGSPQGKVSANLTGTSKQLTASTTAQAGVFFYEGLAG